jgi:lipoyl(octanoyl) transferase
MNFFERCFCVVDPPRSGIDNMRIDRALFRQVEKSSQQTTFIRFYRWSVPTISLGKYQKVEESVDCAYCQRAGIPVVRRPTGGRAVFHDSELTYAVVSNSSRFFPLSSISQTYRLIAGGLQEGMWRLGIHTQLVAASPRGERSPSSPLKSPCFVSPSRYELLCSGRKIVGSAQKRSRRAFLQHGSIPLHVDHARMAAGLGVSEPLLRANIISLSEARGQAVGFTPLRQALQTGFERVFRMKLCPWQVAGEIEFLSRCDFSGEIASD